MIQGRAARLFAVLAGVTAVAGGLAPQADALDTGATPAAVSSATQKDVGSVERTDRAKDSSRSGPDCKDYLFPVTMSPQASEVYQVFGRLCSKGPISDRTIQVLIHGGSYDHNYWDWPYRPAKYSYVKQATEAGFVTLNIDRIGAGYSDRPNSSVPITFASNGWVAHQIVEHLRSGNLEGESFERIILVGHSMGGLTARIAASYGGVDGVVISGFTHVMNYVGAAGVIASFYPAELDPKFAGKLPAAGLYLTTWPGTRCVNGFYLQGAYDPKICKVDEKLKSTAAVGEFGTVAVDGLLPAYGEKITSHVLVTLGSKDAAMCITTCYDDLTVRAEDLEYPNAASYERYIQPRSGHDQNLHLTAPRYFDRLIAWSSARVGVTG